VVAIAVVIIDALCWHSDDWGTRWGYKPRLWRGGTWYPNRFIYIDHNIIVSTLIMRCSMWCMCNGCWYMSWMNEWMCLTWRYHSLTVAGALNKSYRLQVSVVSENGSSHVRSSNDALNRTVLRSSRDAFKDETVLTLDGREFQAHATPTGKARSAIVDPRVDGTVSVNVLADRRRQRASTSVVRWSDLAR